MSQRLYYHDSYTCTFEARVLEHLSHQNTPAVVLDQTLFYPTSGGQPHDTGTLNGVAVDGVFIRPADGAVVHVLAAALEDETVMGQVSWERRFDHMQQHTGQHILSQAFLQVANAATVGFHLGVDNCTIDVDKQGLSDATVAAAEQLANAQIWANLAITAQIVPLAAAETLGLRKIPAKAGKDVRVVSIGTFDVTACGGTHVAATGELGLIKVIRTEKRKQKTRIEFHVGQRALADYGQKNRMALTLAGRLTVGHWELDAAVGRLQDEMKGLRRTVKQQQAQLVAAQAQQLLSDATEKQGRRVVHHVLNDGDAGQLRQLAQLLTRETDDVVAFLGLAGDRAQLVLTRSASVAGDMRQLIKPTMGLLGKPAGGGSPQLAQGGGPAATGDAVAAALAQAEAWYWEQQASSD